MGIFDLMEPRFAASVIADLAVAHVERQRDLSEGDHALYNLCRLEAQALLRDFPGISVDDPTAARLLAAVSESNTIGLPVERLIFGLPLQAVDKHPIIESFGGGGVIGLPLLSGPPDVWSNAREVFLRIAPELTEQADRLHRADRD